MSQLLFVLCAYLKHFSLENNVHILGFTNWIKVYAIVHNIYLIIALFIIIQLTRSMTLYG